MKRLDHLHNNIDGEFNEREKNISVPCIEPTRLLAIRTKPWLSNDLNNPVPANALTCLSVHSMRFSVNNNSQSKYSTKILY